MRCLVWRSDPWNIDEGSPGSSAGSAAVIAADLMGFAIGSETLGSIIAPSADAAPSVCAPPSATFPVREAMAPPVARQDRPAARWITQRRCWPDQRVRFTEHGTRDTGSRRTTRLERDTVSHGHVRGLRAINFKDRLDLAVLDAVRGLGAAMIPLS
jgi:hypothetical protein